MMKIYISLLVCLFMTTNAQAQERILDLQKVTSKSGIEAWLVEDHSLPILSIKFAFDGAGSIRSTEKQQGLARLLSNTMDEGAGTLTSQEFQKALSDHSITLSFSAGRDNFGGKLTTLTRHKNKAQKLLKLALTSPRFDVEPVERMRQSNITRIRSSMGNPNWIVARLYNDLAYAGHPYALNSGGTITSLQAITPDDLRRYKNQWLTRDRLKIGVAGDITAQELSLLLDDVFGALPDGEKAENISNFDLQNTGQNFLYEKDIPQTLIQTSLPSFGRQDPDFYALLVMNHIFGASGFGSRLMEEAREKRGLTYGIYSSLTMGDYINTFDVSTSTKAASTQEMMDVIQAEMQRMKTTEITDQELKNAKDYIIGSMPLSLTASGKIASIALDLQLKDRDITYLDDFPHKIKMVKKQDVHRVAQRIFNDTKPLTLMVGMPENIEAEILQKELPNVE